MNGRRNEYPNHTILEFVSGGAKQYGLKLQRKGAAEGTYEYVLKVRGMTLNWDVMENQGLRYVFKQKELEFGKTGHTEPINVEYPNCLRPSIKNGTVISQSMQKIYKPFIGKGIVCSVDLSVLDFGHISLDKL